ncbi:hypothetical protein [Candidatus Methylacidithermus pantelleriae]|uniref:Putative enzyme n=1 Tax=Candidatus Methylacidithermus pantelleriae TaxID=2744239 RepID=A0A8J2FXA5_9BACT|nr:hypothetical protein [Candidatus Methylacidithermus pantelleriae]CAF0704334.1 putative enzyme [Candidatus Methylacidithermus pantelleriae]
MRLVLTLNAHGKDARFPIHYNEFVQGVIYRNLDEYLAQVFHEEGVRDRKRRLKLFTFSRLLEPCTLTDGWLEPKGPLRPVIASPIVEFLESFACQLVRNRRLHIGSAEFVVESVEVEFQAPYREVVILRVLSPVTVYSTLLTREG